MVRHLVVCRGHERLSGPRATWSWVRVLTMSFSPIRPTRIWTCLYLAVNCFRDSRERESRLHIGF